MIGPSDKKGNIILGMLGLLVHIAMAFILA